LPGRYYTNNSEASHEGIVLYEVQAISQPCNVSTIPVKCLKIRGVGQYIAVVRNSE
jgi:hypothetical protein